MRGSLMREAALAVTERGVAVSLNGTGSWIANGTISLGAGFNNGEGGYGAGVVDWGATAGIKSSSAIMPRLYRSCAAGGWAG